MICVDRVRGKNCKGFLNYAVHHQTAPLLHRRDRPVPGKDVVHAFSVVAAVITGQIVNLLNRHFHFVPAIRKTQAMREA